MTIRIEKGKSYWIHWVSGIEHAKVTAVIEQNGAKLVSWSKRNWLPWDRHTETLERFYARLVKA